MADFVYGRAALKMILGSGVTPTIDLLNDTIKVGLSTSTHVENKDDTFLADGGADDFDDGELSGSGYVAGFGNSGRKTIGSKTLAYDAANDRVEFDGADQTWSAINAGTAAQATLLREVTNDAGSPPIANIDSGGFPVVTNGGDLTIQWNAEGIIHLTV